MPEVGPDREGDAPKFNYCGYSNCFRPYFKMRGFMPVCQRHLKEPRKWGKDGKTWTGSRFVYNGGLRRVS